MHCWWNCGRETAISRCCSARAFSCSALNCGWETHFGSFEGCRIFGGIVEGKLIFFQCCIAGSFSYSVLNCGRETHFGSFRGCRIFGGIVEGKLMFLSFCIASTFFDSVLNSGRETRFCMHAHSWQHSAASVEKTDARRLPGRRDVKRCKKQRVSRVSTLSSVASRVVSFITTRRPRSHIGFDTSTL